MIETAKTTDDPRWHRILARDASADGVIWYSVVTTGVYCRPSCPSRRPLRENAAVHDTLAEARATGFRACLRCDPEGPSRAERDGAIVAAACRAIEAAEETPTSAALAAGAGCSVGHLHRLFRAATGLTPRGYAAAHRAKRARDALAEESTVIDAILAAGYGSASRFYAAAEAEFGMTPSRFRAGGVGETLRVTTATSSLGKVLVASSERGIAAILLGDDDAHLIEELRGRFPQARLVMDDAGMAYLANVIVLVEHPGRNLDLPLDIRGTAFQRRVWQALRTIPPGETRSYAELADALGQPSAVRAVAGACAANAHAVAIPCHRVVRQGGALAGYRWGIERKRALIAREAEATDPDATA